GFHALNLSMFELAQGYRESGMSAYSKLQDREFELASSQGYAAVRHQSFVGTGWFDALQEVISGGESATRALEDSTEKQHFQPPADSGTLPRGTRMAPQVPM